ncbi:hypothetical protein AAMO2058_000367500 [Amorphochlora amoebiformis]
MATRGHCGVKPVFLPLALAIMCVGGVLGEGGKGIGGKRTDRGRGGKSGVPVYSADPFTCADGSRSIPNSKANSRVNDDYCDCADGSDEPLTSACSGLGSRVLLSVSLVSPEAETCPSTEQTCKSPHPPKNKKWFECRVQVPEGAEDEEEGGDYAWNRVWSSMVGDGVCDCCDGSDESSELSCPNTCGDLIAEQKLKLMEKHNLKHTMDTIKGEILSAAKKVEESLITNEQTLMGQMQKISQMAQSPQFQNNPMGALQLRYKLQEFSEYIRWMRELREANLGAHLNSVPNCIKSAPLTEKLYLGGTKNYVAQRHSFEYCPFRYVVQTADDPRGWAAANCEARLGIGSDIASATCPAEGMRAVGLTPSCDKTAKIPTGQDTGQRPSEGNEDEQKEKEQKTVLGHWDSSYWGDGKNQSKNWAIYLGDPRQPCGNGARRKVNVTLECSKEERISNIAEDGMCNYKLTAKTLAACFNRTPSRRSKPSASQAEEYVESDENDDDFETDEEDDTGEDWFEHDEF